jgi:hypothetical protein
MGKRMRVAGLAVAATIWLGCGGDGNTGPNNNPDNGSMSAKVDGSNWSASNVAATRTNGFVGVGAGASDLSTISFAFPDHTGTFQVGGQDGTNASFISGGKSWTAAFGTGGSGTITVTTLSATRVAGTFSFVAPAISGGATGNKTVTNGTFDVAF